MKVLSAQQMRDLEQAAVDNGATYIKLMEKPVQPPQRH